MHGGVLLGKNVVEFRPNSTQVRSLLQLPLIHNIQLHLYDDTALRLFDGHGALFDMRVSHRKIFGIRPLLFGSFLTLFVCTSKMSAETRAIPAQSAELEGGALKFSGDPAGSNLVSLSKAGQGVKFAGLPAGSKLAIRYGSVSVGTISVAVNEQPARKVNVHSSGSLTSSLLVAKVDIAIPAGAALTISLADKDVPVNIDGIIVGDGELGLPPDIWNLAAAAGGGRSVCRRLEGDQPAVYRAAVVARRQVRGLVALGSAIDARAGRLVCARHVPGGRSGNTPFTSGHFGQPSEYGYKDIAHNWVIDRWNPDELMNLYVEMGARYFMAMGVHHDNFDCWDSTYQPWNSVNVGPKVDIVGTWEKVARQHGMRFGIGFHNTPGRTWGQFMPVRYTSDKNGPKKGVPYDALQTILDGKGKWWEGMDPVDLYGPVHDAQGSAALAVCQPVHVAGG